MRWLGLENGYTRGNFLNVWLYSWLVNMLFSKEDGGAFVKVPERNWKTYFNKISYYTLLY